MRHILIALALIVAAAPHAQAQERHRCLARFSSQYLGESERLLNRGLTPAEQTDLELSFDEADALFDRRSRVRDNRYENSAVAYLQRMIDRYPRPQPIDDLGPRAIIAGFDQRSPRDGLIVVEIERGIRVLEFVNSDPERALAYTGASLEACP
jgi:hypothetical protein